MFWDELCFPFMLYSLLSLIDIVRGTTKHSRLLFRIPLLYICRATTPSVTPYSQGYNLWPRLPGCRSPCRTWPNAAAPKQTSREQRREADKQRLLPAINSNVYARKHFFLCGVNISQRDTREIPSMQMVDNLAWTRIHVLTGVKYIVAIWRFRRGPRSRGRACKRAIHTTLLEQFTWQAPMYIIIYV